MEITNDAKLVNVTVKGVEIVDTTDLSDTEFDARIEKYETFVEYKYNAVDKDKLMSIVNEAKDFINQ